GLSKALRQIATWPPRRKFEVLNDLIQPIADDFDVILLDTPPTNLDIQALTLGVAAAVVIPCEIADDTAEDGVIGALTMVGAAKKRGNPTCTVAGVVLAATRLSHSSFSERRVARRTAQETTQRLREFDPEVRILTSVLRQRADANLLRRHGRSTTELLDTNDIALPRRQRRNVKRLKSTIESVINELYTLIPARAEGQPLACTLDIAERAKPTVDITETATETTVDLSNTDAEPAAATTKDASVDLTKKTEMPATADAKKESTS
ncbi:MAG: AAA family ATPase, partial [Actinobacteria bacterium]|nr:AAA family ATPase [Actinomycetota bacterium]